MPSIYVNTEKMEAGKRDLLAEKIYAATTPVFKGEKGPDIHIFMSEYDVVYKNGKPAPQRDMVVINMEAGSLKPEKIETLVTGMEAAVQEVLGVGTTFIYHGNPAECIGVEGVTIAQKMKK